jgi:hypothetical protein
MIAISLGGPIASMLVNRFGLRSVASLGMLMSALSLWGLANTDFMQAKVQVWVGWWYWVSVLKLHYWLQPLQLCLQYRQARRPQQGQLREWRMSWEQV